MNPTILSFDNQQHDYTREAREIRYRVFVDEQHVPEDLEYDEFEAVSRHYLMKVGDEPVATCRWRTTAGGVKLERFAVLQAYRGKGFGNLLVRNVLQDVLKLNKPVYLHAQEAVVPFYHKLGFRAYGDIFVEAGIRHFLMKYEPQP